MRPGLTRFIEGATKLLDALKPASSRRKPPAPPAPRPGGSQRPTSSSRPVPGARPPSPTRPRPASVDSELDGVTIEYTPCRDGDPDPGEVVWTWVPYEDDPSQGKDRPVVVFGRRGERLVGVALTSKHHDNEPQVEVGTGPWDREGRTSYAKLERILDLDPAQVRREGAILDRHRFDDLVAALGRVHHLERRD